MLLAKVHLPAVTLGCRGEEDSKAVGPLPLVLLYTAEVAPVRTSTALMQTTSFERPLVISC